MTPDQVLRGKLRKIEALFAGAATPGEKAAAGAAAERIRERLGQAPARKTSSSGSSRFLISGPGSCSSHYAGATACNHSAIRGCTVKPS